MMMIGQRTKEWTDLRRGKFTASEVHKLMGIKGLGKTGETYVMEKVAESLGATMPEIETYAMKRGTEMEPYAKRYYSKAFGCAISDQPFIVAPWCDEAGCSPDGLVVEFENNEPKPVRTGIEIKCPENPVHHLYNFRLKNADEMKELRPEYYWQVQMCMAVTGLRYWDFVSYYPEIDENYRMVAVTIAANDKDIDLLKIRIAAAVEWKRNILNELSL